jgi:hypothetical protein
MIITAGVIRRGVTEPSASHELPILRRRHDGLGKSA